MDVCAKTVYVVDDDQAVRDSLQWLLESADLEVRTYPTAQAFLDEITDAADTPPAGCLIADLRLPGISGLDLQDRLNELGIPLPVIMITGHGDVPLAVRAMKAGAMDFIEKPFNEQVLLNRVRDALRQNAQQQQEVLSRAVLLRRLDRLTPREREVMDLVVVGRLNKQIATDLGLSHKTVEVHRAHVMEKMEAASFAELVRMAVILEHHEHCHPRR